MRLDLFRRRLRQRLLTDPLLRLRGKTVPTASERRAARQRVQMGLAGTEDGGQAQRDHCLARGYCCKAGCQMCPWRWDVVRQQFR